MPLRKRDLRDTWLKVRTSGQFRNVLLFLVFVAVSALFWCILALNDSVTETFTVRVQLENVPDSVTFINQPPQTMHVTLRDKGTNILRSGVLKHPQININFRDYSDRGIFRMSKTDLNTVLKATFGNGIQIIATSLDSLRCYYTDSPGKRVPVRIMADVTASSGNIIAGQPVPKQRGVRIYSYGDETDTISQVVTEVLKKRDLSQTEMFEVRIRPIPGIRIVPPEIDVQINVEPLVHKEGYVTIESRGVPQGESLMLFPNRVPVSYYVPMSKFNDTEVPISVTVDYADTGLTRTNQIPVRLGNVPDYVVNPEIKADSVEYTLVKR